MSRVITPRKVGIRFYEWVKALKRKNPNITSEGLRKMTGERVSSATIRAIVRSKDYQDYLYRLSVDYEIKQLQQANRELAQKEYRANFNLALATHRLRALTAILLILSGLLAVAIAALIGVWQ